MLFWSFVILFTAGILCMFLATKLRRCEYDFDEILASLSAICFTVSVVGIAISLLILLYNYIGLNGYIEQRKTRYDSLVYQLENDIYDNDNDLGKRELYEDIQKWNEDLANDKANQKDFWIGIYIPNIYDQFEMIELEGK